MINSAAYHAIVRTSLYLSYLSKILRFDVDIMLFPSRDQCAGGRESDLCV